METDLVYSFLVDGNVIDVVGIWTDETPAFCFDGYEIYDNASGRHLNPEHPLVIPQPVLLTRSWDDKLRLEKAVAEVVKASLVTSS